MVVPNATSKLVSQSSVGMSRETLYEYHSDLCTVFTSLQILDPDQWIFATVLDVSRCCTRTLFQQSVNNDVQLCMSHNAGFTSDPLWTQMNGSVRDARFGLWCEWKRSFHRHAVWGHAFCCVIHFLSKCVMNFLDQAALMVSACGRNIDQLESFSIPKGSSLSDHPPLFPHFILWCCVMPFYALLFSVFSFVSEGDETRFHHLSDAVR